jgi:hypothetical protein
MVLELAKQIRERRTHNTNQARSIDPGEIQDRYKNGLEHALQIQSLLLEDIRQLGIIPLLEEVIGEIPPIEIGKAKGFEDIVDELRKSLDKIANTPDCVWSGNILAPQMLEDGTPDPTLVIVIRRTETEAMIPNMSHFEGYPELKVTIEYTPKKVLTIKGEEVTFNGPVDSSTGNLKEEIAQAFALPQTISP